MAGFEIGVITKAQGIRGEFRVFPTTDDPARFELLIGEEIRIGANFYKLTAARTQKNIVILKTAGIDDRNAAEKLIGAKIFVPAEKALELDENEYYIRDLIGLRAKAENGEELGVLTDVQRTGANDVYIIKAPGDGGSFMVPAVKEVVREVSVERGVISLRLLEGMRELTV